MPKKGEPLTDEQYEQLAKARARSAELRREKSEQKRKLKEADKMEVEKKLRALEEMRRSRRRRL